MPDVEKKILLLKKAAIDILDSVNTSSVPLII